jgi:hypothetical protein
MSQHDYNLENATGANFRADLNNALAAIRSSNSGASAPSSMAAHMLWADLTASLLKRRNTANSGWVPFLSLDDAMVLARSSDTTLAGSDLGKTVIATSTFTQTFTAAATLGAQWSIDYANIGSGIITLDPNGSETINGATTLLLFPGESCKIVCDGSAFRAIGLQAKSAVKVVNGTFNVATASGTLSITGAGFRPTYYEIEMAVQSESGRWSRGKSDGASQHVTYRNVATGLIGSTDTEVMLVQDVGGTTQHYFQHSAFTSDGVDLSTTKVGSPTGTINYSATFWG